VLYLLLRISDPLLTAYSNRNKRFRILSLARKIFTGEDSMQEYWFAKYKKEMKIKIPLIDDFGGILSVKHCSFNELKIFTVDSSFLYPAFILL
jgi:hypothetical protein